jgi:hypothetical protein
LKEAIDKIQDVIAVRLIDRDFSWDDDCLTDRTMKRVF